MQAHHEEDDGDAFSGSVAWETGGPAASTSNQHHITQYDDLNLLNPGEDGNVSIVATTGMIPPESSLPKSGVTNVKVEDAHTELEGTKDTFVSYLVSAKTDLNHFASRNPSSRRRFTDFTFLREHLTRDFPAAVVPPLPDKHRMEYFTGDRFSQEFIERRRQDLQRFLDRLARHPRLSRTELFQNFLESTEWNVYKHKQLAHPADPEPPASLLDNLSDSLLNAFAKVRKPDERFVEMRVHLDQFEEGLSSIERHGARSKNRLGDLSGDYEDLANSIQGLGYLESGMTEPLQRFERALLLFGANVRETSGTTSDPFLEHLHSLLAYSAAFRAVLKLRDQKQLDFEELSAYLSSMVSERDRLAGGYGYGMGIGNYFKEKVEALRGGEVDGSREAKMARLDVKIKEVTISRACRLSAVALTCSSLTEQLQDAVINSQDTSQAFNEEILSEHVVFQTAKRSEMKELLSGYCEGQIKMHKASMRAWDSTIPHIAKSSQRP